MYLKSLRLQNFLSHRDTFIQFDFPMAMSIVGQNGAGKSSLVEGIYYALTGKILRDASFNEITNNDAEFHRVELYLVHQGVEFHIVREYHRANTNKKKYVLVRSRPEGSNEEWTVLTTRSVSADWNISDTLFGLDGESARNTFIIGQNDIDGISTLGPSERRSLLIDLLCEGKTIAKVNAQINKSLKAINQSIGELTARRLVLLRDILSDDEVAALEQTNQQLQSQVEFYENVAMNFHKRERYRTIAKVLDDFGLEPEEFIQGALNYQNRYQQAFKKHVARLHQERENLQSRLENLRERYAELKKQTADIPHLEKEVAELAHFKDEVASLSKKRDALIAEKARLEQVLRIDSPDDGNCPLCGRPITGDEVEHVRQYRKEAQHRLETVIKQIDAVQAKLKTASEKETLLNKRTERLNYLKNVLLPEFKKVTETGKEIREKLSDRRQFAVDFYQNSPLRKMVETGDYKAALYAFRAYCHLKASISDFVLEDARYAESELEAQGEGNSEADHSPIEFGSLKELQAKISELRSTLAKNQYRIEQSEKSKALLVEIDNSLTSYREQAEIENLLLSVLSIKDGAPAMMLEESLQKLSIISTQFAVNLAPDVLKIDFISRKQNQNGNETPTLEIQIIKKDGVVAYGALSGGERVKIAFAIRVAISTMLLSSKNIQFFIVDEAMASLDVESRQKMVSLLQAMNVPQVMVITHLEDVANMYPTIAHVYRDHQNHSQININAASSL